MRDCGRPAVSQAALQLPHEDEVIPSCEVLALDLIAQSQMGGFGGLTEPKAAAPIKPFLVSTLIFIRTKKHDTCPQFSILIKQRGF